MMTPVGNNNHSSGNMTEAELPDLKADIRKLKFYYGTKQILNSVSMPIYKNRLTALIGPSGCGKTTLLRCFNRMHDLYAENRYEGGIVL